LTRPRPRFYLLACWSSWLLCREPSGADQNLLGQLKMTNATLSACRCPAQVGLDAAGVGVRNGELQRLAG
jgi:hypothetical protein